MSSVEFVIWRPSEVDHRKPAFPYASQELSVVTRRAARLANLSNIFLLRARITCRLSNR